MPGADPWQQIILESDNTKTVTKSTLKGSGLSTSFDANVLFTSVSYSSSTSSSESSQLQRSKGMKIQI